MHLSDSRIEQLWHEPEGSPGRARVEAAIAELVDRRRVRGVLPPDHPLVVARQHGVTTKEIVGALGWRSTARLWNQHSTAELARINAAVARLIAAKEQQEG